MQKTPKYLITKNDTDVIYRLVGITTINGVEKAELVPDTDTTKPNLLVSNKKMIDGFTITGKYE